MRFSEIVSNSVKPGIDLPLFLTNFGNELAKPENRKVLDSFVRGGSTNQIVLDKAVENVVETLQHGEISVTLTNVDVYRTIVRLMKEEAKSLSENDPNLVDLKRFAIILETKVEEQVRQTNAAVA